MLLTEQWRWRSWRRLDGGYAHSTGKHLAGMLDAYFEHHKRGLFGNLPDHRTLVCNTDDYLRLAGVPARELPTDDSCFRSLEGVVTHGTAQTTACAGHTYHPRLDGKTDCPDGGRHDTASAAD